MDTNSKQRCKVCGEARIVTDEITGTVACEACGGMLEDSGSEFASEFQLGLAIDRGGTLIGENDTGVAATRVLMRGQISRPFDSAFSSANERYKVETMKRVQRITAQLRVPSHMVPDVSYFLERTVDADWGSGRWVDIVIASCVYIVIRQSQLPLTIPEVADCVNCDVVELGRMYNRVLKKLNITVPHVDLQLFLDRAFSTLPVLCKQSKDSLKKIKKEGIALLRSAEQWFITTGRRPLPVVAAVLQLVLESNQIMVPITDVAKAVHAGIWATKLRYKECKNSLVSVAQKLPWGADVTAKTVLRHLPFIIHVLELKLKLQKGISKKELNSKCGSPEQRSSTTDGRRNRTSSGVPCGGAAGLLSTYLKERNNHLGHKHCDDYAGERPAKFMRMDGSERPYLSSGLIEVDLRNGDEAPPEDSSFVIIPKMGGEKFPESSYPSNLSPRRSKLEVTSCPACDVLPVAFVANQEARERRLRKIHLAKSRISQYRSLLAKKYGLSKAAPVLSGSLTLDKVLESDVKGPSELCSSPDAEDLRIERLLLKGASREALETGYYKTLEANFSSEREVEGLDAKDRNDDKAQSQVHGKH